jgi:HAD superfamily hydrolase (TIGR01509 family)
MRALSAVVFDFDGVVLDTETAVFESYRQLFHRCGASLSVDEWCGQVGIYPEHGDRQWLALLQERGRVLMDAETFEAEKRKLFDALVASEPMRGIPDLLASLRSEGIPTAIASTSPARWVLTAVSRLGLDAQFDAIVTADDVARRKPEPDVYVEAARRLGADPARTVAIEDSATGLAAARAAGMKAVAIPHWLTEQHDLDAAHLRVRHAGELTVRTLEALVTAR